jgi:hypothetical protein
MGCPYRSNPGMRRDMIEEGMTEEDMAEESA